MLTVRGLKQLSSNGSQSPNQSSPLRCVRDAGRLAQAPVARETRKPVLSPLGITLDWLEFADAWRGQLSTRNGRSEGGPFSIQQAGFVAIDEILTIVLKNFRLEGLAEQTRSATEPLCGTRLDAWPDVKAGLARLHQISDSRHAPTAISRLMVDLARRNGLVWDAILGSEIARDYKPSPSFIFAQAGAA